MIDAPLPGMPWASWQPEVVVATLKDLLSERSARDPARFKKLIKTLCGGKKKGQGVPQPAKSAAA